MTSPAPYQPGDRIALVRTDDPIPGSAPATRAPSPGGTPRKASFPTAVSAICLVSCAFHVPYMYVMWNRGLCGIPVTKEGSGRNRNPDRRGRVLVVQLAGGDCWYGVWVAMR
jgi:hypothetical protein